MELMMRNPTSANVEQEIDMLLEYIKEYPKSIDNIWMCTIYGYPKMEAHKAYAKRLVEGAKRIRETHVTVSMQISNTIGHGDRHGLSLDFSGLVFEGSPVETLVGHDGKKAGYTFCWRGEYFRKYMKETLKYYMEVQPDCLWIDDDLRPDNHNPVSYACFCDHCIDTFNAQHGSSFTREALVQEFLHGDKKWRKRYIDFIRQGIYDFTYDFAKTVHELSPNTMVCLQNGPRRAYSGFDHTHIFDAIKDATGKAPKFRPGAGAYDDHNPNVLVDKMVDLDYQTSLMPDYVKSVAPEIESLPCQVFGKSPAGNALETSIYFAAGYTDMSYSMLRVGVEDLNWYKRILKLFEEQRPYWEELTKRATDTHQSGLCYFLSRDSWARDIAPDEDMKDLNMLHYKGAQLLLRDAFPITFYKEEKDIYMIHPDMARIMSDAEIQDLMGKCVVTDAETIKILIERGYEFDVKAARVDDLDAFKLREKMVDHPVNPAGFEAWKTTFFTAGKSDAYRLYQPGDNVEVISVYDNTLPLEPYGDDEEYPYGIAGAVIKTVEGGTWGVLGYVPWKGIMPMNKREQMLNLADYISGNKLAARVISPIQAVLLPRENLKGETVQVSLINCTVGHTGEIELLVRRPVAEDFYYMSQTQGRTQLPYRKEGENYIVTIPDMEAWTVGTVFCD